jgi:hypothetical protein
MMVILIPRAASAFCTWNSEDELRAIKPIERLDGDFILPTLLKEQEWVPFSIKDFLQTCSLIEWKSEDYPNED